MYVMFLRGRGNREFFNMTFVGLPPGETNWKLKRSTTSWEKYKRVTLMNFFVSLVRGAQAGSNPGNLVGVIFLP